MVKVLFCGGGNRSSGNYDNINNDEWILFIQKLTTLQNSTHGPFDLLFCPGQFFPTDESYQQFLSHNYQLPLPTYIFDQQNLLREKTLPSNLFLLPSVGTVLLKELTIGCYIPHGNLLYPTEYNQLLKSVEEIRYDLLLTSQWPQQFINLLPEHERTHLSTIGYLSATSPSAVEAGQRISNLVTNLRPRYHLSASSASVSSSGTTEGNPFFYQRLPYLQSTSPYSDTFPNIPWFTRFIGLAPISASKEKHLKWMHALSLEPISASSSSSSAASMESNPSLTADTSQPHTACPYTSVVNHDDLASDHQPSKKIKIDNPSLSAEWGSGVSQQSAGSFFFGDQAAPRKSTIQRNTLLTPPSADSKTLFLGGLFVPRPGQPPINYGEEFRHEFVGVLSVRQPAGKPFAFVEFDSPESAMRVVEKSQESVVGLVVRGNPLTVGWAANPTQRSSSSSSTVGVYGPSSSSASLAPPSTDCKTLFVGGLFSCDESLDSSTETKLRQELMTLFDGCIEVRRLPQKSFGFLEFETHLQAASAMVQYAQNNECYQIDDIASRGGGKRRLSLGWSKGTNNSANRSSTDNGPQNNDCWFCLASPNVKVTQPPVISLSSSLSHIYFSLSLSLVGSSRSLCVRHNVSLTPSRRRDRLPCDDHSN
jgi:hypothetical protein